MAIRLPRCSLGEPGKLVMGFGSFRINNPNYYKIMKQRVFVEPISPLQFCTSDQLDDRKDIQSKYQTDTYICRPYLPDNRAVDDPSDVDPSQGHTNYYLHRTLLARDDGYDEHRT